MPFWRSRFRSPTLRIEPKVCNFEVFSLLTVRDQEHEEFGGKDSDEKSEKSRKLLNLLSLNVDEAALLPALKRCSDFKK